MMAGNARTFRRRRGAVIMEFVFCLPVLAFLLGLIFFLGWAMMNQQHVKVSARHTAWRNVRQTPDVTGMELNKDFFANRSDSVQISLGSGPDGTLRDFTTAAASCGPNAGILAQRLALEQYPRGSRADVSGHFPSSVALWQRYQGSIQMHRAREGVEWRRHQADNIGPVRELFLMPLDNTLDQITPPGRDLGQMMRQIYLAHW